MRSSIQNELKGQKFKSLLGFQGLPMLAHREFVVWALGTVVASDRLEEAPYLRTSVLFSANYQGD
jgi:hypothetical protein